MKPASLVALLVLVIFFTLSCSNGPDPPATPSDSIPPAPVSDLAASDVSASGDVTLTWTATGDDGSTGTATAYVVKYDTSLITAANFDTATTFAQTWTPVASGSPESRTVTGLVLGNTYYFAVKVQDEIPNTSAISSIAVTGHGIALGWIGGGQNGWQTGDAPSGGLDYQSFQFPMGLYVDTAGMIFIGDALCFRVSKWTTSGIAVGWIGGGSAGWKTGSGAPMGTDYQSFWGCRSVCADGSGNIYIAEEVNNRVSKWDSSGNALGWIGGGVDGWQQGSAPSAGSDYRSFNTPYGVFTDASGAIFVADYNNNRVSKWTSAGTAVGWLGGGTNGWQVGTAPPSGTDYRSFDMPYCVSIDATGDIFIADRGNNRISKWDSSGNAIGWIGGGSDGWQTGAAPGSGSDYRSFWGIAGLCLDGSGNIFAAETGNDRVSKWDSSGNAIGWLGGGVGGWQTGTAPSSGASDYQSFDYPIAVAVDGIGNIYVADQFGNRICKWKD